MSLFLLEKHRTLPSFTQSAFFRALKARSAARLPGAAHPGPSLDLGSRGCGITQDLLILAFLAFSCTFPLARATRKSRDCKFPKLQHSSLLNFQNFKARGPKACRFLDLSVPPIDRPARSIAKSLEGCANFQASIIGPKSSRR